MFHAPRGTGVRDEKNLCTCQNRHVLLGTIQELGADTTVKLMYIPASTFIVRVDRSSIHITPSIQPPVVLVRLEQTLHKS